MLVEKVDHAEPRALLNLIFTPIPFTLNSPEPKISFLRSTSSQPVYLLTAASPQIAIAVFLSLTLYFEIISLFFSEYTMSPPCSPWPLCTVTVDSGYCTPLPF